MAKKMEELDRLIDGLLFELCEAGIYELGSETSPELSCYDDVAGAADKLNNFVSGDLK